LLLATVTIVIARLPKIDVGHTSAFRKRRVLNWLPLGLTYAFLYMGRYNLKVSKFAFEIIPGVDGTSLMGNADFNWIFAFGTIVYACSFLINGPLTDRFGGRFSILVGAAGVTIMNLIMGLTTYSLLNQGIGHTYIASHFVFLFAILYGLNMYFQSFGAVAIVKVNAAWFHVRERGVFGAIFGILISLGIYFAFDWGYSILESFGLIWVFFVPAALLTIFWVLDVIVVRDLPSQAGHVDFETADATSGDHGPQLNALQVFNLMRRNPVIVTIALIEFCSGFLRQSVMQWFQTFASQTDVVLGLKSSYVYKHWGLLLCCAGILGGVLAGVISDHIFESRRGPVAGLLYGVLLISTIALRFTYQTWAVGFLVILLSMAVIGVHGMLSGTASMDFGGQKNVGIATGIIDGFVYLGTGTMALIYGWILPEEQLDAAGHIVGPVTDPANWSGWPAAMIPFAAIGAVLAYRIRNAKPKPKKQPVAA
jgi:OPA family glycerol-3-phosphate transporter-like MFS transporter